VRIGGASLCALGAINVLNGKIQLIIYYISKVQLHHF